VGREAGIANPRSALFMKDVKFGAKGEEAVVLGIVAEPDGTCDISSLVIVRVDGSLPDPLCFRRFVVGPGRQLGDAGLERFRGVIVVEVVVD